MMYNGFEQDNAQKRALLHDFFMSRNVPLSDEEAESLTPILNGLQRPEARYEVEHLIAEGGEKKIFRVYDQRLNRYVAMAQAVQAETPADQERFLREGQLTANLTHPNIVPVYNMGIDPEGNPFFSMELVPGDSLRDIIEQLRKGDSVYRERYSLEALLSIFNKVCDAVAYAHSRNVLHLDIKPANIRVGEYGEVFLCDWGLARVEEHIDKGEASPGQLDGDLLNDMTLTGTVKGTPGFMAPEQVANLEKTQQTDIYALGAILYLMLTHELPVDGRVISEVLENTRNGNVIPPRKRATQHVVPRGIAAVALKALALTPEHRYVGVPELQVDVNRFLAGYPTRAERAGRLSRLGLWVRRHRTLALWVMAFSILLVAVMSVNLVVIRKEKLAAEANLALFLEEQEKARYLDEKLGSVSFYSKYVTGYVNAVAMVSIIDEVLAQKPGASISHRLLPRKAELHFLLQQFNAAHEACLQLPEPDEDWQRMQELCREFAAIKPNDGESLAADDFSRLLIHAETATWGRALLLYYYQMRRHSSVNPEEHVQVVGVMLARLNEIAQDRIPDLQLSKRAQGYHLDLSHTPYSTYLVKIPNVSRKNVIQPLELYSLDISHTPVSLVRELELLKLKELRMVGVSLEPVKGLSRILREMGAERVVLGKGDYATEIIQLIQDEGVEVVEEEYQR